MIIIIILLVLVYLIFHIKKTTSYWQTRNVMGPKPIPIFGNIIESVLRRKNITTIYKDIYNDYPNEKVVGIYTMTSPALLIRDLEIAKQILIKDFNCFSERGIEISKKKLGDSLFHCDSDTWRALKGKLTPYFSNARVKSSFNVISESGDRFVKYIEKVTRNDKEQELQQLFRKFAIEVTLGGIFDLKIDTYSDVNKEFLEKLDKSIFKKSYFSEMGMIYSDFMKLTNTSLFGKTAIKFCDDIVKNAFDQRKKNIKNSCVMDMLLDLKETDEASSGKSDRNEICRTTDHVIASQVFILFATGYENASLCLSYAFNHLAKNIDLQDRLINQIDDVMLKHDGLLTHESLNEITYLKQVFYETLRLSSFTNTLQRKAMRNYTIPGTNIEIEKGVTVLISHLAFHHDEKYYKKPLKFDPERFNLEKKTNACSFMPFGLGPRSCFGYKFTKLLFKIAMVKILTKFIVRPSEKITEEEIDPFRTLLAMKNGIYLNIISRNFNN